MNIDETLLPGLVTLLLALAVAVVAGPSVIAWLRVLKFGQNINEYAPESHQKKQGTPSMGGVMLVLAVTVALLVQALFADAAHRVSGPLVAVWLIFVGHAVLGFTDDYLKAKRGKSLGLKARQKLAGQLLLALLFVGWLYLHSAPYHTTVLTVWRGVTIDLGPGYYVLAVLLLIGMSNATNLTDGLDGLAGGLAVLTALGLAWTVYTYDTGDELLPRFGYAVAGACLGFLWYNTYPAKVFMGDTGSLALGSSFAAMAIIGKQEVLLLIFALVFVLETVSVMIQVTYFKMTKGKRVFKMTPLHHHFELSGWPETQVVARFWILGLIALAVGLLLAPSLSVFARR